MSDCVVGEVCGTRTQRNNRLRLTPWSGTVTDTTEWCCGKCALKAFRGESDD